MPKYIILQIAFTNTIESSTRPIAIVILLVLTLVAVIPPIAELVAERLMHNPFEVAFVYPPYPPRPIIDDFLAFLFAMPLLLVCIIAGIGLFKRQSWARSIALCLFAAVIAAQLAASILVGHDTTGQGFVGGFDGLLGRYTSMVIALIALYMLSRKDVRIWLQSPKQSAS